jgi:hypothetical protein
MQSSNFIKSAKLLQYFNIFIYAFKEDSLFCIQKNIILIEILINLSIKALINLYIFNVCLI